MKNSRRTRHSWTRGRIRHIAYRELQVYGEPSGANPGILIARTAVLAGRILLENGAEIRRTEDTMSRICSAGGACVTDAYATPGMLMISFTWQGQMFHNMKRVTMAGTDLHKIEQVNALSRQLAEGQLSMDACYRSLCRIQEEPGTPPVRRCTGAWLAGAGFALVFGATLPEAIAAAFSALLCMAFLDTPGLLSPVLRTLAGSALITLTGTMAAQVWGLRADPVILAALMILVPGMLFTTALQDCAAGDILSGQARFSMALLNAAAIALGNIGTLMLLEGL